MVVRESFDILFIIESLPKILSALPVTLYFTGFALLFGWPLGLLAAWGKISGPKWLKALLSGATDIIRGIPIVVLLYIVYFGLPNVVRGLFGANIGVWPKQVFIVIALVIELMTNSTSLR